VSLLQSAPRLLEFTYLAAHATLAPFRRWLQPGGAVEQAFVIGESLTKGPVFDCRMCGQCILHQTGMTCPMTCPKEMRNGPCGGVRPDGGCEVRPDMTCVWLQAWQRSKSMARFGREILHVQPPVDRRLEDTSAWINEFAGRTGEPAGWRA
jgi:hypothetical protein